MFTAASRKDYKYASVYGIELGISIRKQQSLQMTKASHQVNRLKVNLARM